MVENIVNLFKFKEEATKSIEKVKSYKEAVKKKLEKVENASRIMNETKLLKYIQENQQSLT